MPEQTYRSEISTHPSVP